MSLLLALGVGTLIGLSLGALGAGGSILAVPALVYLLGQSPVQATSGSLVVVAVTSLIGAVALHHAGKVMLARGIAFGLVAIGGAVVGARASALVPEAVLVAAFSALMLFVGGLVVLRQILHQGRTAHPGVHAARPVFDDPIIAVREGFLCDCPRAFKVLVTATTVGLLTGFLGVGGGFLVVPALVLALALPIEFAAGTSLVAITITSTAALAARVDVGVAPNWWLVTALTAASSVGGFAGARAVAHVDSSKLSAAFAALVLAVAGWTAVSALPAIT